MAKGVLEAGAAFPVLQDPLCSPLVLQGTRGVWGERRVRAAKFLGIWVSVSEDLGVWGAWEWGDAWEGGSGNGVSLEDAWDLESREKVRDTLWLLL